MTETISELNRQHTEDVATLVLNQAVSLTGTAIGNVIVRVLRRVEADIATCGSLEEMAGKVRAALDILDKTTGH